MRHIASIMALALTLAACSSNPAQNSGTSNGQDHVAAEEAVKEGEPSFVSKVGDIRISAVSALPVYKDAVEGADLCNQFVLTPKSSAAKAVGDAGWAVTGEARAGPYDAVSFVGGFEPGTSGTCTLQDGNVALFKDGAIKAIAYGRQKAQLAIGLIATENGNLKIQDGNFLHELAAQIVLSQDGSVTIVPPAKVEKVCGGGASLPNIQNMPINKARDVLIKAGWKPAPRAEPVREIEDSRAYALAQAGVIEVDSCSGTGMGYCGFDYKGTGGHLSVTTVGDDEWPTVTRFGVDCD